eukprot:1511047-Prorocentrum_lima.AAC.1
MPSISWEEVDSAMEAACTVVDTAFDADAIFGDEVAVVVRLHSVISSHPELTWFQSLLAAMFSRPGIPTCHYGLEHWKGPNS